MIQQITTTDIYSKISRKLRVPLKEVKQIGEEIWAEVQHSLLTQREVKVPFGTFELIFQEPETQRNVRNQTVVRYGPGWKVSFKPSSTFRNKLRGDKETLDDPELYYRLVDSRSRMRVDEPVEEEVLSGFDED